MIVVTRPRKDAERFVEALRSHGKTTFVEPMFHVHPLPVPPVSDHLRPQAILATSRHAIEAFSPLAGLHDVLLLAVGDATAEAARDSGFTVVESGGSTAAALVETVRRRIRPENGPLLYLRGTTVSRDLAGELEAEGYRVESLTLYETLPRPNFSAEYVEALRRRSVTAVTFFSQRTAAIYTRLAESAGLAALHRTLAAIAISEPVADVVRPLGWGRIIIARAPNAEAMIEAAIPL